MLSRANLRKGTGDRVDQFYDLLCEAILNVVSVDVAQDGSLHFRLAEGYKMTIDPPLKIGTTQRSGDSCAMGMTPMKASCLTARARYIGYRLSPLSKDYEAGAPAALCFSCHSNLRGAASLRPGKPPIIM